MSAVPAIQNWLDAFAADVCLAQGAPWLHELRQQALARFAASGFPTPRNEAWKYTDLRPLEKRAFPRAHATVFDPARLAPLALAGLDTHRVFIIDGRVQAVGTATAPLPAGVTLNSLTQSVQHDATGVRQRLAASLEGAPAPLDALNLAFLQDGVWLEIAPGIRCSKPIELVFVACEERESMAQVRVIANLGANSCATVLARHVALRTTGGFTNVVWDVRLEPGSRLTRVTLQEENAATFHFTSGHVTQSRDSRFESLALQLGARMARDELAVTLGGAGASATLSGLYLLGGRQHVDNHIHVEHAAPHTTSRQLYRGVLDGHARGIYTGRVIVTPGADGTDAQQSNANLLLSAHAEADTRPQLEIHADDVKCSHGATVGQLDEDALFYLLARGLDRETARDLLVYAFADTVLTSLPAALRRHAEHALLARLPGAERIREFV